MATIQDELQLTSTDATEVSLPIAGTGSRSYAFLIDWHIRIIVALAWLFGSGFLLSQAGGQAVWDSLFEGVGSVIFYVVLLPAALIYGLYHPLLEVLMKGRTPGKRAAGIRIVSIDGQTPDVAALLIRNIFRLIDSLPVFYVLGLACVLLSARQVRIGDMAAGTLLVHEKKLARNAFDGFAEARDDKMDVPAMEVAEDLLRRWRSLQPGVRTRIALKLLEGQGESIATGVPTRTLEADVYKRLVKLAHAKRA